MCKFDRNPLIQISGAELKILMLAPLLLLSAVIPVLAQAPRPPGAAPAAAPVQAPEPAPAPVATVAEPAAIVITTAPESSALSPNTFAQEALKKLSGEMQERNGDLKEAAVVEDQPLTPLPSGVLGGNHEKVLDDLMNMIFLKKGNSWFTQTVREAIPVPYEFKDLQLSGPTRLVVTEADKANGIDQRLSYGFSVSAHRRYAKATGWQAWEKGKPVLLTGIIMNRVRGIWVVASSPRESYSLR